jgi:hypothetical protein
MSTDAVLDLFAGLGGFSQAFAASDRWDVTTVEIEARFEPDRQADVFELRPSDFDREFDVVLASPPCTQFATIRNVTTGGDAAWVDGQPGTDAAADALALVHHTVGLIRGLAPTYWVLENPRGMLRTHWREPTATVWYCQYGADHAKPTDLWGDHPPMRYRTCAYGNDCCGHVRTESYKEHGGGSDNRQGLLREGDAAERAKVPAELSRAIRDACERGLDDAVPEQTSLAEVTGE